MAAEPAPTVARSWQEQVVKVADGNVHLLRGGSGDPVVALHHDIGNPGWLPFYEQLARRFSVYVPSHPGYGESERPTWMRNVRDMAIVYQWLLKEMGLSQVSLVGLGFGGWIAAEMATMAPAAFRALVLVGAMGIKPERGEIMDQALVSYIDYVVAGFHDRRRYEAIFTAEPDNDQLVAWDLNREMTFRIAWKPYMYNPSLPHLLGGVGTPALVVWGDDDRIVPLECGERYAALLPGARLDVLRDCGHFVEMEQPAELARLVTELVRAS